MANTFAPFGFRQLGHQDGSAPTMGLQRYVINSSDTNLYFTGDTVALSGAAAAGSSLQVPGTPGGGVIGLGNGSTASGILGTALGTFAGCEFFSPSVGRVVWSSFFPGNLGGSSTPCNAYIQTDPEMQYICQVSSAAITSSQIGQNINILTAQSSLGNQTTGVSAQALASSTVTNSASLPYKIVDLYSNFAPPGATGINGLDNTTNFNIVVVVPNNWVRKAGVVSS